MSKSITLDGLAVVADQARQPGQNRARTAGRKASHGGRDARRLIKEEQRNPPLGGGEAGPRACSGTGAKRPRERKADGTAIADRSGGKWWVADRLQRLLWWSAKQEGEAARVPAIGLCGQKPFGSTMTLNKETTGRVWADGIARCGSPRCVLCAGSVARRRADYLSLVLAEAKEKGMKVGFVTLTASHSRSDGLADLRKDLAAALSRVRNGEPWKRLMSKAGIAGTLRWWESTWGEGTGWHMHCHMLVFVQAGGDLAAACEGIISRWREKAGDMGRVTARQGQDWRAVETDEGVSEYPTGDLVTGLSHEAAGEWTKTGRRPGRMSPGELASLAAVGDRVCQTRYLELVESLRGLRGLTIDRRLSKLLNLGPEPVDEDAADDKDGDGDEAGGETAGLTVPAPAWAALVSRRRRGEALAAAAADWKAAPAALTALSGVQVDPPPVVPGVQGMKPDHDAADAAEGLGAYAPTADRGGGAAARLAYDPETGEVLPVIAAG